VVDYLATLPQVDMRHIAIFGYSRDGKMAALAGALDPRIIAVIAGSTGVGGILPWRASGERGFGEGIESTTRSFPTWFAPQLRFFAGREDRLPVDGNLLAAMIAPRSLLMEWGNNDQVSNTWGIEQTYYSALKVYQLLGVPDRISTLRVPGFHGANDEEADLDWLDIQFGRTHQVWTNNLIFQWNWDTWRTNTGQSLDLSKYPKHTGNDLLQSSSGEIASPLGEKVGGTPQVGANDVGRRASQTIQPGLRKAVVWRRPRRGSSSCRGCAAGSRGGSGWTGRGCAGGQAGRRRSAGWVWICNGRRRPCSKCRPGHSEPSPVGHQQWWKLLRLAGTGEERGDRAAHYIRGSRGRSLLSEGHARGKETARCHLAAWI
jgi:hypothetical protein